MTGQTQLIDLMPTLLGQAGGVVPEQCEGLDLLAQGEDALAGREVGMHVKADGKMLGRRSVSLKAMVNQENGEQLVYSLKEDPAEMKPLAPDQLEGGDEAAVMKYFQAWRNQVEPILAAIEQQGQENQPKLSKEQVEALKALGYLH